ncbi:MAG: hypothetical protein IJN72_07895 [Firmicutes bacterium]|nr:hypothetical protein [Bacillota bacterium]
MKKTLITMMCVMMVIAMMPAMAFAEISPSGVVHEVDTLTALIDAVKEASDGDTIKLMADIEDTDGPGRNYEFEPDVALIYDLNDCKLTLTGDNLFSSDVTFMNGAIEVKGYASTAAIWMYDDANLVLDNVTFTANGVKGYSIISGSASGTITISDSEITVSDSGNTITDNSEATIIADAKDVTITNTDISATDVARGFVNVTMDMDSNSTVTMEGNSKTAFRNVSGSVDGTVTLTGCDYGIENDGAQNLVFGSNSTVAISESKTADVLIGTNAVASYEDGANINIADQSSAALIKKCVAKIGDAAYATLQAAIDVATATPGTYEIVLAAGTNDEDIVIHQTEGVNITIKGNGTDTIFTGYVEIYGHCRYEEDETLIFDGVVFQTSEASHVFIEQTEQTGKPTSAEKCYPHNVTVQNCSFTATDAAENTAVGMKFRYGYNIKVKDTESTGLHSLMQNYAGVGLTIEDVNISGKSGIALGTSQNVTVKNATMDVAGYGLRVDAQIATTVTVEDCDIEAFIPVVVRKAEKEVDLVFNGDNTMDATNTDGIWCAIGTSEYEENGSMPTAPTGTIDVTLNDADLAEEGIYPREGEKAPEVFVASKLTTDIADKEFIVGEPTEFTFTTTANDHEGEMVIGTSNFSNAAAIEKLEYYEVSNGQWYELSGDFGPATGFPMADATSKFRVTFKTAGTYTFTASMKLAEGGTVLCSTEVEFTVKEKEVAPPPTYTPSVTIQKPVIESAENATVTLGVLGTTATIAPAEGYEIADVTVNGVSKGAVTSLSGLKTGDVIVVETKPIKTEAELVQEELNSMEMVARSKRTTSPSGKNSIMVYWYDKAGAELEFDGVEIFRSTKKSEGFKKVFTSKTDKYYNTAIEEGVKYYYRVRGFVTVDGEKLYTDWSLKAIRTAK